MSPDHSAPPRLRLLGPVELLDPEGGQTSPPGPRARSLMIAAALADGHAVSPERLIDDIWGADAPSGAKTALHTLISRTRSLNNEILQSTPGGYRLNASAEQVDLWRAEQLLREAASNLDADPSSAITHCQQALELWQGEPGLDAAISPARDILLQRANQLQTELSRTHALALVYAQHWQAAVELLSTLLLTDPLDEQLNLALIRSYRALGRTPEALARLETFRRALKNTLGSSLSEQAVALQQELLQAEKQPALRAATTIGLRAPVNRLLGREADLAALDGLLSSSRVVSILGPGGLGKTRLATELAQRAAGSGTPAVAMLELASVRNGADIWLALGSLLGIAELRQKPGIAVIGLEQRIVEQLHDRRTLLVMDNCEHLVEAAALVIAELIRAVPSLTILCTSRSPLNIAGEFVYLLQPLAITIGADQQLPAAIELFLERARAARPSAPLDLETVTELCDRLDGLPLAIELAAARIRTMSVAEILDRISQRFTLLRSSDRSIEERHRTLHAVIDWSWSLLSAQEQASLRRLCSFPNGFSREAAIAVAGADREQPDDVEADLEALLNQSLLRGQEHPLTGQLRYRMLETVREFGNLEQLKANEQDWVAELMLDWARELCQERFAEAYGPGQIQTIRALAVEQDNLIYLLRRAMTAKNSSVVLWIFALLGNYWSIRSAHQDVISFAPAVMEALRGQTIADQDVPAAVMCFTLVSATLGTVDIRLSARARATLRRLLKRPVLLDEHLRTVAGLWLNIGSTERLLATIETAKSSTNPMTRATGAMIEAFMMENSGQSGEAIASALRAYRLGSEIADTWTMGTMAASLSQIYAQRANHEQSLLWGQRALQHMVELDAVPDLRQMHAMIAANQLATGDLAAAVGTLNGALAELPEEEDDITASGILAALRAEVELSAGNAELGLAGYRLMAEDPQQYRNQRGPYGSILVAAAVCAFLLHDPLTGAPLDRWVQRVRVHCIALRRLIGDTFLDRPVVGTAALTVGSWGVQTAPPGSERSELGLRLLLLSDGRQDLPSLLRERHLAAAKRRLGATTVDAALASQPTPGSDAALAEIWLLLSNQAFRI
ncbi:AfsR/SARP family transcriptional regulator [Psychromicrobium lacuslunae]|uniref:AfsR/SARP family transcriptional regulator n=1 Tax=Psychromicrobium lacuslunae TaxID=1618207 RepID=UPI000696DF35|nr:BTAD domain-containing putative transcriptional regulator [Psychromicrobium lacuslunae]